MKSENEEQIAIAADFKAKLVDYQAKLIKYREKLDEMLANASTSSEASTSASSIDRSVEVQPIVRSLSAHFQADNFEEHSSDSLQD